MAKFRCRTCGKEGTFVYDRERYTCPICDSIDVQFAIGMGNCRRTIPSSKR